MNDLLSLLIPQHSLLTATPYRQQFELLEILPHQAFVSYRRPGGKLQMEKELMALWDDCEEREEEVQIIGPGVSFRTAGGPIVILGREATFAFGRRGGITAALKDGAGQTRARYRDGEWRYAESAESDSRLLVGHMTHLAQEVRLPPPTAIAPGRRSRLSPLATRLQETAR